MHHIRITNNADMTVIHEKHEIHVKQYPGIEGTLHEVGILSYVIPMSHNHGQESNVTRPNTLAQDQKGKLPGGSWKVFGWAIRSIDLLVISRIASQP